MKFKVNDFFGLFRTKQWWAVSHQNSAHEIEVTGAPRLRGGYLNFMSTCLSERVLVARKNRPKKEVTNISELIKRIKGIDISNLIAEIAGPHKR